MSNFDMLLDNIKDAEGGYLHYNSTESDVTTGYGIYRARYPKDPIWDYIDSIASTITDEPSKNWSKFVIDEINKQIDPAVERKLSEDFYRKYFKRAHLELFPKDAVIMMANLFTNSQKGAWESVQDGLIDVTKFGLLDIPEGDLSIVDGDFGKKTSDALKRFNEIADFKDIIIFKLSVISYMKTYYIDLGTGNPAKFLKYLDGWDRRMEKLQHQ